MNRSAEENAALLGTAHGAVACHGDHAGGACDRFQSRQELSRREQIRRFAAQLGVDDEALHRATMAVWSNLNPQSASFTQALSVAGAALSACWKPLQQVACLASDDEVKRDLELTCTACGQVLCDVQHDDTLSVLLATAEEHVCGTSLPPFPKLVTP